jgi:hypothetical protein
MPKEMLAGKMQYMYIKIAIVPLAFWFLPDRKSDYLFFGGVEMK